MKKNYINYLLWISFVFNIAFLGHFIYKTVQFHNFEKQGRNFAHPHHKHKKNKRALMNKEIDPVMEEMRLKNVEYRIMFFNELAKENPDYSNLDLIADSLNKTQSMIESHISQHFILKRQAMDTDEAIEFYGGLVNREEKGCRRIKERQNRRKE
ncbi:MAG TPA: hypothetical protein PL063_08190 [Candidatus Cloacimonadota bacterium]|jgi:hypothetical protein|nr:hypothetical protein [Candidatus Cloacimonadales bacterium]HPY97179.1 hypothetical protein [Candidatus Cloacimonadota bacterium]HQB40654.1 hypothetical protein [Candidatus Cloacimonadota bacterium]